MVAGSEFREEVLIEESVPSEINNMLSTLSLISSHLFPRRGDYHNEEIVINNVANLCLMYSGRDKYTPYTILNYTLHEYSFCHGFDMRLQYKDDYFDSHWNSFVEGDQNEWRKASDIGMRVGVAKATLALYERAKEYITAYKEESTGK